MFYAILKVLKGVKIRCVPQMTKSGDEAGRKFLLLSEEKVAAGGRSNFPLRNSFRRRMTEEVQKSITFWRLKFML